MLFVILFCLYTGLVVIAFIKLDLESKVDSCQLQDSNTNLKNSSLCGFTKEYSTSKNDTCYFLGIESISDVSLFLCLFFLPGDEPQFNSDRSDISCIFLVICTCHTTCGMDRR